MLYQACVEKNLATVKYLVEKHECNPSEKNENGDTSLNIAAFSGSLDILMYLIEERKCSPGCPGRWGRSPLHNACGRNGNIAMVKYLVEKHGCDPSGKDEQGNTPLNIAAFSGSLDILMYLIEERKCSPGCPGQWGRSPLHNACGLAMVKYLVEMHGCDPSGKDEQGNTPLNIAAFSGSLDILMYLIEEQKCSPGCPGQWGRSPLHNACGRNGNLAMVKYLVEKHGCDPSGKDEQGNTPLNLAAVLGSLDTLIYLIEEQKCSPGCPGRWGRSPLHNACGRNGNVAMVKYLVEKHGCDPSRKDDDGDTPLNIAALSGSLDILMYLIEERKCSPGCPGQWGRSPLHNACERNGNVAMVKYLVEKHGCDPSRKDDDGDTPLNIAALSGSLDILMYLIEERKCSPGCPGRWGRSPLHNACGLAMVKYLVEMHGCDPTGKDEQGNTPLNIAAFSGSLDILMYLIEEQKCSPGCPGQWGRSPLHNACGRNGNLAMVKYLVEKHGCDPSGKDEQGNTPLNLAAVLGSLDTLIYLIEEQKCSPGCPGRWGRSPLHNACGRNGNIAMVKYLVEKHGCDPSGKDEQGNTPLNIAAFSGSLDILMYLIEERKCSPGCPGQWGRSPLHNACERNGNVAMVKYLVEKHGCDPSRKDDDGDTPLNIAALSGSLDILMYLIEERKCSPGCPGQWGRSPLHNACGRNGNVAMVKYLVEKHGCDPSGKDDDGDTPLNIVAFSGSLDILMYLIEERKCSPGCPGQWGRSPLHNACGRNGNVAMVKYLVEKHGCDPSGKDDDGNTPLDLAAALGSLDTLIYLIEERKCSPGCPGQWGRLPLHNACGRNGNLAMVKYLVEKHGCDPSGKDEQGNTPLNLAAVLGSLDTLIYLIEEQKCSPGCPGQWGRLPLHDACGKNGNLAMVKYLVEKHGCDPSGKDDDGNTPLDLAAALGSLDTLIYLIEERKCSPGCPGRWGRSPLHNACGRNGNIAMVKYLVEKHGCDPSGKDDDGDTPLSIAAFYASLDILMYLIEERKCTPQCLGKGGSTLLHNACVAIGGLAMVTYLVEKHGCELSCKDIYGHTPLDMATTCNNQPVIKYLKERIGCSPGVIHYGLPAESKISVDARKKRYYPQNRNGIELEWDHPAVQNDLGPMLPDWCTFQKWSGDIVFANMGGAYTIQEDPRAALQRYRNALKDGFVSANIIKILIIGAAGVGKTHLLHLLLNKQPPDVRYSTPVMERPLQVIRTTLKHSSLESLTDKELYELLARTVNKTAADSKRKPVDNSVTSPGSNNVGTTPTLSESVDVHSNSQNVSHKSKKDLSSYTIDPPVLSEVEEKMIPYIAESKDASPILDVDWMYFIDSGGQSQFHQLLPAFMHHSNLNIFVLRLCDKLSDHPAIDYYDERGTCISSTPSSLTNKEILQCCAQATQTVDQDGVTKLLIVGTHRDLEDQCDGETRDNKNVKLLELLIPSMEGHLMYFAADGSELIFPLNCKDPNDNDRKLTNELCQAIVSMKDSLIPQKIPLRWLVFHQEIQALSKKTNVVVLSLQECSQVAIRLHMVDDTKAALQFFSDLNVILYYPSILPNLVFTNPQCILDIISEIVKFVAFDRTRHFNEMLVRANKQGIISEKLFEYLCIETPKHQWHCTMKKWTLAKKQNKLLCVHSNCIKMCFKKSCSVILIDNASYVEIHLDGDVEILREVCPKIRRCLVDACEACEERVQIAFLCPCKLLGYKHLAIPTEESLEHNKVVCSKDELKAFYLSDLGANAELWLHENKQAVDDHSLQLCDLMNDVAAVIPAKWRLVGVQLKLPNGTLDEIQAQNAGRPDQCILSFEQMFAIWRSLGTSPYTWETLINTLRSPAVGEVKLANKLNTKMHVSIAHA
ncbi:hypothetical protein EMCRGX_G016755 [Ephydatia muelleri]